MLITTSGPGITNAVTALATAYADSIPVLAVSPGPPRGQVRADVGWLHEVKDQQAALDAVTGRSIRVESADEIPEVLAAVFEGFATTRPRPVHLEVPGRRAGGRVAAPPGAGPGAARSRSARGRHAPRRSPACSPAAARPLLVVGGGARGAAEQVRALADHGVPVLTTVNGKGILDESHPAALGAGIRLPAAHRALNDADVLLVVGSELGDSDLWGGVVAAGAPGSRTVVRVDLDPAQMHKNVTADLAVVGDAAVVLGAVLEALRQSGLRAARRGPRLRAADRRGRCGGRRSLGRDPAGAARGAPGRHRRRGRQLPGDLLRHRPPLAVHAGATGCSTRPATRRSATGCPPRSARRWPSPRGRWSPLFGDGAAMFSIQELITATEQGLAIPVVIVDNGGYAEIREQMVDRGIEPQAVDLYRPDIPALARAIGAHGVVAADVADLGPLASAALQSDRPTVIHLLVERTT